MEVKKPKQPKPAKPVQSRRKPVDVRSYVRKGKRIKAYKRNKAGDKPQDESR